MKKLILAILILAACATYAFGKIGLDLGLSLGSGSVSVTGPVTPTGNYLLIDNAGHYLLIDGSNNKLRIDGAS